MPKKRISAVVVSAGLAFCLAGCGQFPAKTPQPRGPGGQPDYFQMVKAYADTMLEKGRDKYANQHSALFATTLNRQTLTMFDQAGLMQLWQMRLDDWKNWRVRNRDRMTTGANPMHDQNLYQILYALAEITNDASYAEQADKTIRWFFKNCQSPSTGLLAWGEHMGWDFNTEDIITWRKGTHNAGQMHEAITHEFAGPWVLWDRSFEVAPLACEKFALGLWEHQIGDHNTGNFSRHANYRVHQPQTDSEYPRHGGFYIATWAQAYKHTNNSQFLKAIEILVDYFDGRRSAESDGIPAESAPRSKGEVLWATSNLSLAIDLWQSADYVPAPLAGKMRNSASRTDKVFLKLHHDLTPNGRGFLLSTDTHTLQPYGQQAYTGPWDHAGPANLCMVRYRQTALPAYSKLVLDTAELYLHSEPEIKFALHPSSLGHLILLMLDAYELTGRKEYLERADYFAQRAIDLFFDDTSPLPKATSKHDHYEAVTGADTLITAMLRLWAAKTRPDLKLRLVYCDR